MRGYPVTKICRFTIFMKLQFSSDAPFKKKLFGLFLWMRFWCLKATEPLRGGSLLFTTKFLEIASTHFINLERMKG